ncbi:unnamed protein product [Symbiodinium sp. CCMP2592]|nr:unnamed protein product [Symbiodinium sp. CCMP2592]
MSFTKADLLSALGRMAGNKALPASFAPARLWKLASAQVCQALLPAMNLQSAELEPEWHKVQLHMIPKVAIVREPKALRPIALLHPANKLLATMIADQVQGKIAAYLSDVPQWAYLPGRSTADALESACSHLHQVRSLVQANTQTIPQRFQGHTPHQLIGGISISLDVKKAFDSLSHGFLEEAMREALFSAQEISLILHLHSHACLQVSSGTAKASVYLGTGVRQGCSLSPLLWALATGRVYRLYLAALREDSLPEGLTNMFADDFFGSWTYRSPDAFRAAIRSIGTLVHTLKRVGLELSLEKTVLLMASTGTSVSSVVGGYRVYKEGATYLQIPVGQSRVLFKVVSSHKYLGARLSYQGFELLNLKHRLATAWGSFWRLHSILISRALPLHTRTRLWMACVFSVLRYSLHHVGLPKTGPLLIRQAVHRQLRMIARSPAHLWHVPSSDILVRLGVEDPWMLLSKQFPGARSTQAPMHQTPQHQLWSHKLAASFSLQPLATEPPTSPGNSGSQISFPARRITSTDQDILHCASERRVHAYRLGSAYADTVTGSVPDGKKTPGAISIAPSAISPMDLEGVTREELEEAAAELTHLQTMAIQGRRLFEPLQFSAPSQAAMPLPLPTPLHSEVPGAHPPTGPSIQGLPSLGSQHEETDQPSKYSRPNDKGQGGKGPRNAQQPARRHFPSRASQPSHPGPSSASSPPSKTMVSSNLVLQIAQLVLRHADAINALEQSTTWIMFQGTAPPLTAVDLQAAIATEWHQLKDNNPSAVTQPLRVILWQTWASELVKRLQLLTTDQERRQEAVKLQILSEPDCFKYVKWNSTQRRLEPIESIAPLTLSEIVGMLQETIVLCKEDGVLINFHPMRRLTPQMAGSAVSFSLHLGLRESRAYRFWTIIETLAGNSSLQLVATTIRRDKRGRSPLAQAIEKELRKQQSP